MIIEHTTILTQNRIAAIALLILQVVMIAFYGVFLRYQEVYPSLEDLEVAMGLCLLVLVGNLDLI